MFVVQLNHDFPVTVGSRGRQIQASRWAAGTGVCIKPMGNVKKKIMINMRTLYRVETLGLGDLFSGHIV